MQNEPLGDDEVSDKPHVPWADVVDVEQEKDKASHVPPAPYPHRLRAPKKVNNHSEIYELFKQVKVNIPLLDAIKKIPSYVNFLKDLCTVKRKLGVNKDAFMTEQSTSLIRNNFPPKYKDPGSPTISILVKDVLVQVDEFYFPMDFIVLDTQPVVNQGTQFPVILGHCQCHHTLQGGTNDVIFW